MLKRKLLFLSKKHDFNANNLIFCPAERAITANRIAFGHDLGMFWAVPSLNFKHARTSLSFVQIRRKYHRFEALVELLLVVPTTGFDTTKSGKIMTFYKNTSTLIYKKVVVFELSFVSF